MKRYLSYLWYVLKHKWFVLSECWEMRSQGGISLLWRGVLHDLSKFLPDEFVPYARYFYNQNGSLRDTDTVSPQEQQAFDLAWLRHIHRNAHHWQHYSLIGDDYPGRVQKLPMRHLDVLEMAADWVGAGRVIHGRRDVGDWYKAKGCAYEMHPRSKALVEIILGLGK